MKDGLFAFGHYICRRRINGSYRTLSHAGWYKPVPGAAATPNQQAIVTGMALVISAYRKRRFYLDLECLSVCRGQELWGAGSLLPHTIRTRQLLQVSDVVFAHSIYPCSG